MELHQIATYDKEYVPTELNNKIRHREILAWGLFKFWEEHTFRTEKKRDGRAKLAKQCVSDFRPTFSSPAIWLISSHIPVTVFPAHSSDRWKRRQALHSSAQERNGQAQRLSLKRWYETVTISKQLDSDRRAAYVPRSDQSALKSSVMTLNFG